ncbi:MAG TPA: hypothetical protein VGD81_01655 [Opitutaceae bacterium]
MSTPRSQTEQEKILASDLDAFLHEGHLLRRVSENDDDCRRDSVEIFENGKWHGLIFASLDWEAELARLDLSIRAAA